MKKNARESARQVIATNTEVIRLLLNSCADAFGVATDDDNARELWANLQQVLREFMTSQTKTPEKRADGHHEGNQG